MTSIPPGPQDPHFEGIDPLSATLLGALADGVFIARDYRFIWGNDAIAAMLGYTPETFAGLPFAAVIDPAFLPRWTERFTRRIAGTSPEPPRSYELRVRRNAAPTELWVELRARRIFLANEPVVLGVLRDITERKASEAAMRAIDLQMRSSQKMEAMGRLASAVAHDFNNLLQIIRSSAELLRSAAPGAPTDTADLDAMLQAVDRAAALTTPLLAFGRHQHAVPELLAPCSRARSVLADAVPPAAAHGVQFRVQCDPDAETLRLHADPGQFDEVLRQLARNAAEAMSGGGTVEVHLTRELVTEPIPHRHGIVPSGEFLRLSVADVGCGMSEDVLDRIFEPFFTTKAQGMGPGLGMAVVYGVVRAAGGSVTVRSAERTGTTVTVFWPCAPDAAALPTETAPLPVIADDLERVTPVMIAGSNADESPAARTADGSMPQTTRLHAQGGAEENAAMPISHAPNRPTPIDSEERLLADGTLRPSPRPTVPVGGAGPLLLVVDDEEGVRRTVTRMLERTGYRVVGASHGREGLAVLEALAAEGTTVHGVVTDVRMPQLGGVEMVAAMMERGWYLPVLFVSGQLDAPLPEHWPTTVSRRFLRKPFTLMELQSEVTALLQTSPVAGTR